MSACRKSCATVRPRGPLASAPDPLRAKASGGVSEPSGSAVDSAPVSALDGAPGTAPGCALGSAPGSALDAAVGDASACSGVEAERSTNASRATSPR